MTQKKRSLGLLAILLMLTLTVMLAGCKAKTAEEPAAEEVPEQEEVAEEEEPAVEVVKVIDEIDTEDMVEPPLQIESITLFEDGSLRIVPQEDLLKNAESNNEVVDGIEAVQLMERLSGTTYNLGGQQVNRTQKGIHIVDGKKIVVK